MFYYHIVIEKNTKDRKNKNINYYKFDIENEGDIIENYLLPYLKDELFFIEGAGLLRTQIEKIQIKKTKNNIENIIENKNKETIKKYEDSDIILLWRFDKKEIMKEKGELEDVTDYFIKKAQEIATNKTENINAVKIITKEKNNKIFIVHGHNEEEKRKVKKFLEYLELTPVILHEQANEGKTIIEKLEYYSDVMMAIVLYTPCDEGKSVRECVLNKRARQNVVFEHGYLMAKLGRENVIALNKSGVEKPGDISGVLYIDLDESNWKERLIMEFKGKNIKIKKCNPIINQL